MKRLLVAFTLLVSVLTLSACGLFQDSPEDVVDDTLEEFDGTLGHLEPLFNNIEDSDTRTIHFRFDAIYDDGHTRDEVHIEVLNRYVRTEEGIYTELLMDIQIDDEEIEIHVFTVETDDSVTFYVLADRLFAELQDELDEEADIDIFELFAIEHDYLRFEIEEDLLEAIMEHFQEELGDEIEDELGVSIEDFEAMLAEKTRFEKYTKLAYYDDHEHLEVDLEKSGDTQVETRMTMNRDMFEDLVADIFDDILAIMRIADDSLPEDKEDFEPYREMMDDLDDFESHTVRLIHEPYDPTYMDFEIDFLPLIAQMDPEEHDSFELFQVSMHMSLNAEIELPGEYTDLNRIIDEIMMASYAGEAFFMLQQASMYADIIEPGEHTLGDLEDDYGFMRLRFARSSTIEIIDTDDFDILGTFKYLDDRDIFHETLSLMDFMEMIDMEAFFAGELDINRELLLAMVALVDEENYEFNIALLQLFMALERFAMDGLPS